eukprot:GHUV01049813.1.p1 GENE.GHUV01049813.1~~GHUV01049813.1.p1  ORF type:complete len:107 (+),score=9.68 GHUV01049813.1:390-710(+)
MMNDQGVFRDTIRDRRCSPLALIADASRKHAFVGNIHCHPLFGCPRSCSTLEACSVGGCVTLWLKRVAVAVQCSQAQATSSCSQSKSQPQHGQVMSMVAACFNGSF